MKILNPVFLLYLPFIAVCFYMLFRKKDVPALYYSRADFLGKLNLTNGLLNITPYISLVVMSLLFAALLRPVKGTVRKEEVKNARDIFIVMDTSLSMNAVDLPPNRLATAKKEAAKFIKKRVHDRLGLVVFGGLAHIHSPLTLDHGSILRLMGEIKAGMTGANGTAIGDGLAIAVKHLAKSEAATRIMIILTDGANNRGSIAPEMAAELAKNLGIKIYTVGIGSRGQAKVPMDHPVFGKIMGRISDTLNEPLLKKIAADTGGKYYRASTKDSMGKIYAEIDRLEVTKVLSSSFLEYREYASGIMRAAFVIFCAGMILRFTFLALLP